MFVAEPKEIIPSLLKLIQFNDASGIGNIFLESK